MERVISVEEKIKRAEEIYARRHGGENNTTSTSLSNKEEKEFKLIRKMVIQIIVSLLIYSCFYIIQNNNYIFTEDFLNSSKEILSYDINFSEIYNNIQESIKGFFKNKDEQNIGGSNEEIQEQTTVTEENEEKTIKESTEETAEESTVNTELSEEEKQILKIKETSTFIKPVEGWISSKYGYRNPTTNSVPKNHTGTDIAANIGTPIISATNGVVEVASSQGDYGKHLKIKIGDVTVVYAHCNKLYVNEGEEVTQGQEIAEVGTTGNSTGPHLHFEIRLDNQTIDPEKILEL